MNFDWQPSILYFLILTMLSLYRYAEFCRNTIGLSAELYTLLLEVNQDEYKVH